MCGSRSWRSAPGVAATLAACNTVRGRVAISGRRQAASGRSRTWRQRLTAAPPCAGRAPAAHALDLRGKPIAITARQQDRQATAIACAPGCRVSAARREDRLKAVVGRIRAAGGHAVAVACDVDRPADSQRLVETAESEFGGVFAVFANAGYGFESQVLDMSPDRIEHIFRTNFYGTMHTLWAAAPRMLKARAGHLLICSSCLSKLSVPMYAAYSATKAAQDHFGRALRLELAGTGVHCSTVHPVQTRTEFSTRTVAESGGKSVMSGSGSSSQTPETVARAIVVACSPKGGSGRWTTRLIFALATAWPGLADRLIARGGVAGPGPRPEPAPCWPVPSGIPGAVPR